MPDLEVKEGQMGTSAPVVKTWDEPEPDDIRLIPVPDITVPIRVEPIRVPERVQCR